MQDEREMVPFTYTFCRKCDGRVELGRVAFGTSIACPHCGFEFVLHHPGGDRNGAGQGGGSREHLDFHEETLPAWAHLRRGPPLRLFLSGTFTFPLRPTMLGQTSVICALGVAMVAVARLAAYCIGADNEQVDRATRVILWNGLLFSTATGAVVVPVLIWIASAYGMTILRETSNGIDAVQAWPRLLALEGFGEIPFILFGLLLALLPGVLLSPLWSHWGVPASWAIAGCAMLLFPPILLSMLDADRPTHCVSPAVWMSLIFGWRAWLRFHLTTFATAIAIVGLGGVGMPRVGVGSGTVMAGIVLALAWMVYFRLLGRLAWFGTNPSEVAVSRGNGPGVKPRGI